MKKERIKIFEMFFDNKKGGEKLLSIWWFLILIIVGAGIALSVTMFYSTDVDVRKIESEILYEKVFGCIVKQNFLISELFEKETEFDIFDECELNKIVFKEEENFYFRIRFLDDKGDKLREDIKAGQFSFEKDCDLKENTKAENYPECTEKAEMVFYYDNEIKKVNLSILTASNQEGNRISIAE